MKTYSHPATRQDLWLMEVLGDKCNGTALELGGYDGITHSNTLLVEELGWQCTLIEPVPEFAAKMRKNRPKAYCLEVAVAPYRGDTRMYVNGEWSGIPAFMSETCRKGHEIRKSPLVRFIPCCPLVDCVGPVHYNYVSLDTEGSEYEILQGWLEAGGSCDALTVEFNFDGDKYDRLVRLCDQYGMTLDRVQGFDLFFLRKP